MCCSGRNQAKGIFDNLNAAIVRALLNEMGISVTTPGSALGVTGVVGLPIICQVPLLSAVANAADQCSQSVENASAESRPFELVGLEENVYGDAYADAEKKLNALLAKACSGQCPAGTGQCGYVKGKITPKDRTIEKPQDDGSVKRFVVITLTASGRCACPKEAPQ